MRLAPIKRVTFGCVFSLAAVLAQAADWPAIDVPPKSHVEWVGQDMKMNGVPLQVQKFDSALRVDEVLTFFRTHWGTQEQKKSVENVHGAYTVIGRRQGDFYFTAQIKPSAQFGSEGFLSVSKLPSMPKPDLSPGDLPVNSGTRVLSVFESNDAGKSSRQVMLANRDSVQSNVRFYEAALESRGWTKKQSAAAKNLAADNNLSYFQKGNQELNMEILRQPRSTLTLIVANIVTNSRF